MKLDKQTLKKLIVETIQEVSSEEKYDPDAFQPYEDEPRGASRELEGPSPEQLGASDIAGYFKQVGEDLQNQIEMLQKMPKIETGPMMTPEDVQEALNDMDRVQQEIEEIKKTLEGLMKRDERGE